MHGPTNVKPAVNFISILGSDEVVVVVVVVTVMMVMMMTIIIQSLFINPLKPELNSICYLLALLGAHNFLHVSRIRVKLLTLR